MRRRKLVATAGVLSATAFAATVAIAANFGLVGRAEPASPVGRLDAHHDASTISADAHAAVPVIPADLGPRADD
jgi:hypothetical protein